MKIFYKVLILKEVKNILEKNRHKKNVDSGSTFKTFVGSKPMVKNGTNIMVIFVEYQQLIQKNDEYLQF